MTQEHISEEKLLKPQKVETAKPEKAILATDCDMATAVTGMQQTIGNRAIQRLLVQHNSDSPSELDDETITHINRERGGGRTLDGNIQARISEATGQDISGVKVHTGPEAHVLNEQLSAKAFTTGSDIFFREGAYDPGSSSGQELLAHELTHVVQQRSGAVGSGDGRMTVNPPGDRFEQEADAVAKAVTTQVSALDVQRQMPEEENDETLQRQELDEDEEELNV